MFYNFMEHNFFLIKAKIEMKADIILDTELCKLSQLIKAHDNGAQKVMAGPHHTAGSMGSTAPGLGVDKVESD